MSYINVSFPFVLQKIRESHAGCTQQQQMRDPISLSAQGVLSAPEWQNARQPDPSWCCSGCNTHVVRNVMQYSRLFYIVSRCIPLCNLGFQFIIFSFAFFSFSFFSLLLVFSFQVYLKTKPVSISTNLYLVFSLFMKHKSPWICFCIAWKQKYEINKPCQ